MHLYQNGRRPCYHCASQRLALSTFSPSPANSLIVVLLIDLFHQWSPYLHLLIPFGSTPPLHFILPSIPLLTSSVQRHLFGVLVWSGRYTRTPICRCSPVMPRLSCYYYILTVPHSLSIQDMTWRLCVIIQW